MLGVRFDLRPLGTFFQIIDPELLRHRLIESLYYLHMQPPGFNLYTGVVLKLFPASYTLAFHAVYLVAGAAICCMLYHLMRVCRVHPAIAFTLASLFITSPGVVLYENFFLHEYLVVFLLLAAAAALHRFFAGQKTVYAAAFFCCVFLLFLIRSHFHLVYVLLTFACLWYFAKRKRRVTFIAGILPLVLASALCFKNWVLFHSFSSSTW